MVAAATTRTGQDDPYPAFVVSVVGEDEPCATSKSSFIRIGWQRSMAPNTLASELLTAALIDAWAAAGNPMPGDDVTSEHDGV